MGMKIIKRISDWLYGFFKTHSDQLEPKDDMRIVKSSDGFYAIESWSKWGGWTFYSLGEYRCERCAREAMDAAKKYRAERIARESRSWTPLNES
jgi:hypothetical protein